MARRPSPPEECAQCGAAIPPRALACPECGADERTGWREASPYDGLDLPDSAYEDDPATAQRRPHARLRWYWLAIAALLAALFLFVGLGQR